LQTGIVVKDLQASMENYWRTLGIGPWKVYTYPPPMLERAMVRGERVEYANRIAHAQAGPVQLELIQPLSGPSIFAEHLQAKGEGLHHIQSRVENIEEVLAAFQQLGLRVLMSGKYGEGEFYFLDTEPLLGVVYEIFRRKSRPDPESVYPPDSA